MFRKTLLLFSLCSLNIFGQESKSPDVGKFYKDNQGNYIYMPMGKMSFADSIVAYSCGFPKPIKKFSQPKKALGEPDYTDYLKSKYVSLGCEGHLVVQFTDNGFIDRPGKDLYFFEVGPSVEAFDVEISSDGKHWVKIGPVGGGYSFIDIAEAKEEVNDVYYYIRITDLRSFCPGKTPGADIDAVGTVSSVYKMNLNGDVLFDSGEFLLQQKFIKKIAQLAHKISNLGNAKIIIQGHTDNTGATSYNKNLSLNRANRVADELQKKLRNKGKYTYRIEAFGESRPIASNATEVGKQKNRRVEVLVIPVASFYNAPVKQ